MSENAALQRAKQFLDKFDSSLIPREHELTTKTSVEAAQAINVAVGQIAKTILFRCGESYGLFVAAGDIKICDKKVKALLGGGGRAKIARPDEVEQMTGYQVGGVCPFDINPAIPIFLDCSMERFDLVFSAAGTAHSYLPITIEQLRQVTGGKIVDMQKDQ